MGARTFIGLLLLAPVGAIAGWVGCRPTEGTSGVHVVIDLDPDSGWDANDSFDHIKVVATSEDGSVSATVCVPRNGNGVRIDAGTIPDPCADLVEGGFGWTTLPTVGNDWSLGDGGVTINFDIAAGSLVTVTAEAYLGGIANAHVDGSVAIGTATGSAEAGVGTPTLNLPLVHHPPQSCPVGFSASSAADGGASAGVLECKAAKPQCLCNACLCEYRRGCSGAAPAVECTEGGGWLIDPTTIPQCNGAPLIRNTTLNVQGDKCVIVNATGHFYRCLEGDPGASGRCTPTTNCKRPDVNVVVRPSVKGSTAPPTTESISCVPPFAFPVPIALQLTMPVVLAKPWLELEVTPSSDPESCLVEFKIDSVANACP